MTKIIKIKAGRFSKVKKHRWVNRSIRIGNAIFSRYYKDLSEIEERGDRRFFIDIGKLAATNAINENKAMKIPVTFMEDGWVVRRMPQGNVERVIKVVAHSGANRARKLTKGTVLHVKKVR